MINELCGVLEIAFLTALNTIEQAGLLKKDSELKDLALVMAIWIEQGAYANGVCDKGGLDLQKNVVKYAKKFGIELSDAGVWDMKSSLDLHKRVKALKGGPQDDRWGWANTVRFD